MAMRAALLGLGFGRGCWRGMLPTTTTTTSRHLLKRFSATLGGGRESPISNRNKANESVTYGSWIDRVPQRLRPYLYLTRLDKPIGTWLLYWPCAWSITMAAYHIDAPLSQTCQMLALFGVGAVVMRGAGCTINDMWDRKIDRAVERTKGRPLAAGHLTYPQALGFLAGQLTLGLAILTQLNMTSILVGASSLSLVVLYPLMKRITYYPQAILGLTFNWGAFLGWSAMTGSIDVPVTCALYAAGLSWTLVYDTIYAHQDKLDDVKVGVKSTALRFGDASRPILAGFGMCTVAMLGLSGYLNEQGLFFATLSCGGAAAHLAWQLTRVNFNSRPSCWKMFVSNSTLGWIVWAGLAGDYLSQTWL